MQREDNLQHAAFESLEFAESDRHIPLNIGRHARESSSLARCGRLPR